MRCCIAGERGAEHTTTVTVTDCNGHCIAPVHLLDHLTLTLWQTPDRYAGRGARASLPLEAPIL
jgi:hypothetical protein